MRGDRTATSPRSAFDDVLRALDAQEHTTVTVSVESRRYGKPVTVIDGLGDRTDTKDILRALRQGLATGGSAREGRVELQGDHRRRAVAILAEHGIAVAP